MTYNYPNEKAPGAMNSKGLRNHTNGANFRTGGAIQQAPDGKAIANQVARLALAGHVVNKGADGNFTVSKYGMTRYCADFAELQAFALKLGVNQ